jgi:hypothetical protein
MAETLKFSVGKIRLLKGAVYTEIGVATGITVKYSAAAVDFRGGDYDYPVDIKLGDLSCEITADSAKFESSKPVPMDDTLYDLVLETGKQGGGLTGTIKNMKIISYEVKSAQNAFVVSTLVMRKTTELT